MELLLPIVFRNKITEIIVVLPSHKMVHELINRLRQESSMYQYDKNSIYGLSVDGSGRRAILCGKRVTFLFEGEMTEEYLRGRACYDVFRIDRLPDDK